MAQEVVIKIRVDGDSDIQQLEKDIKKLANSTKQVEENAEKTSAGLKDVGKNGGAIAVLDELTGGLATKTRDVAEATELFNFKLKGTRTALIATGIGAFVIALGTIVAYWDEIVDFITLANKKLEIQAETLRQSSAILDSRIKLNQANQKLLESQGKSTKELVKEEKELIDAKIANLSAQEKILTAQLENEKSTVKEVTLWERIKINALEAAGLYEQAAKARAEAIIGDEEERQDLINREKALIDLQANIINLRKERLNLDKNGKGLGDVNNRNREQDLEIIPAGRVKKFTEDLGKLLAEGRETGLEELRSRATDEIEAWQQTEDVKTAITAESEEERNRLIERGKQLAQEIADAEAAYKYQTAMSLLSSLGALAEQGSAGAKAIAITQAVISTYQGINKALAETTDFTPTQTLRFANAAAVGLAGFANVANILKTNPSGVTTPNIASVGGARGGSAPSFNVVGTSGVNQLAESLQQDQQPIEAYVVANNVTTAQSLNNNIIETASIG